LEETKVIDSEEIQTIAAGRAKTYAVLAALYTTPPSEELAAMIRAGGLAPEGSGALGAAANELTEFFRVAPRASLSRNIPGCSFCPPAWFRTSRSTWTRTSVWAVT